MIPKVEFVYSFIYDKIIVEQYWKAKFDWKASRQRFSKFVKKLEPKWRKIEKAVLSDLAKSSGLKWSEPKIKCYVTTHHFFAPFSDPLTIGIYNRFTKKVSKPEQFIQSLMHELIHQLFVQQKNKKAFDAAFWKIAGKYPKEIRNTKTHILLQALLRPLIVKYFGNKMLKTEIERSKHFKMGGYYEAWQIVEKEGYQNIISEFRSLLKAR